MYENAFFCLLAIAVELERERTSVVHSRKLKSLTCFCFIARPAIYVYIWTPPGSSSRQVPYICLMEVEWFFLIVENWFVFPVEKWLYYPVANNDFIIEDTGVGMSGEFIGHIFEQFAREKTSTVSHTQGTGLGMSITKSLVDLMGGEIRVESELGKGSVFTVSLEFKITSADMVHGKAAADDSSSLIDLSGRRVLLVEDNDLNMEIAKAMLEAMGLEVETASDGSEALEKVKKESADRYDLILMDIQMPMMNGYEATRAIRALDDRDKAGIPIIAMTANAFDEDRTNAFEAGMNDHIAKPLDITILRDTIAARLQDRA